MLPKRILRTPEAARYLGLAVSTLIKKRFDGTGPPFVRLGGRAIGYDVLTLNSWLRRQQRSRTSDTESPQTTLAKRENA